MRPPIRSRCPSARRRARPDADPDPTRQSRLAVRDRSAVAVLPPSSLSTSMVTTEGSHGCTGLVVSAPGGSTACGLEFGSRDGAGPPSGAPPRRTGRNNSANARMISGRSDGFDFRSAMRRASSCRRPRTAMAPTPAPMTAGRYSLITRDRPPLRCLPGGEPCLGDLLIFTKPRDTSDRLAPP